MTTECVVEMAFKINDLELQALYGLSHLQQLLYMRGLRPYMDYSSGIVGIKRGISYQSLSEACYVEPQRGVVSTHVSHDQIKRCLATLERVTLIKRQSIQRKKLIVTCLLADRDKAVSNKAAPYQPRQDALNTDMKDPVTISDLEPLTIHAAHGEQSKAAVPPVSGKINTLPPIRKKSYVTSEFRPCFATLEQARQHQCDYCHSADELMRFISYQQSKGTQSYDWDAEYLRWLLTSKRYHKQEKHYANKRTGRSTTATLSAFERTMQANREIIEQENIRFIK